MLAIPANKPLIHGLVFERRFPQRVNEFWVERVSLIFDFAGFLLLSYPLQRPPVHPAKRSAAWQQNQAIPISSGVWIVAHGPELPTVRRCGVGRQSRGLVASGWVRYWSAVSRLAPRPIWEISRGPRHCPRHRKGHQLRRAEPSSDIW